MNSPIFHVFNVVITPWKLIGYLGVLLFAGRWVVQVLATRRHGKPVIPLVFWLMSICGSALLCAYFIWGKNDSVGLISNLFPMGVAIFNLIMDMRSRQPAAPAASAAVESEYRHDSMVTNAALPERHRWRLGTDLFSTSVARRSEAGERTKIDLSPGGNAR